MTPTPDVSDSRCLQLRVSPTPNDPNYERLKFRTISGRLQLWMTLSPDNSNSRRLKLQITLTPDDSDSGRPQLRTTSTPDDSDDSIPRRLQLWTTPDVSGRLWTIPNVSVCWSDLPSGIGSEIFSTRNLTSDFYHLYHLCRWQSRLEF